MRTVKHKKAGEIWGLVFVSPYLFGLLALWVIPTIAAFGISLTNWDLFSLPRFVGLVNYKGLVEDPVFIRSLINTWYYALVSIPISMIIALLLAIALNKAIRGIVWLRTIYFLPYVTSTVAVALLWSWIYNYDFGLLNHLLDLVGISPVGWLTDQRWAMPAIMIMSIWKGLGYNIVLFLAGLQNIPKHLYESAEIDGATGFTAFRYITIPLLSPTTFFMLIMGIIGALQVFEQAYIMTKGGPGVATYTIVYYLWEQAFRFSHMGYASAMGWALFLVIFTITIFNWKFSERFVHYQ